MNLFYKALKISFFVFLDMSGILLGIFLILFGIAVLLGCFGDRYFITKK